MNLPSLLHFAANNYVCCCRSALPVSAMMLKDVEASSAQADLTTGKIPTDLEAKAGEAENLLTVSLQEENQSLKSSFLDTLPKVPLEKDPLDIQISSPQIQGQVSKPRTALPFAKSLSLSKVQSTDKQTLEAKSKPRLPFKSK